MEITERGLGTMSFHLLLAFVRECVVAGAVSRSHAEAAFHSASEACAEEPKGDAMAALLERVMMDVLRDA